MKIKIDVEVEVEHRTGKFIAAEELAEELADWIENADEGSIFIDESEYEIVSWETNR